MVERQLISLPSQLQLLDRLQHIAYISSSLILICGEQGAGKTTLAELLFNKLPNDHQQLFIALSEPLSDAKIRTQIISQLFEQPLFDADDSLYSSIFQLQKKHNKSVPIVIVLDNAELLSAQLLTELAQLIRDKDSFIQSEINIVLLIDEKNIVLTVDTINALSASRYIEFKIEPLDSEESSLLLKHLLNQSQYSPQIEHQDALSKQLVSCAGLPENIIQLTDNICNGKELKKPALWLKTVLPAVLLMLLLLCISAGFVYMLYPQFIQQSQAVESSQQVITDSTPLLDEIADSALTTDEDPFAEPLAADWNDKETVDLQENLLQVGKGDENEQRTVISEPEILALSEPKKEPLPLIEDNAENASEVDISLVDNIEKEPLSVLEGELQIVAEDDLETVPLAVLEGDREKTVVVDLAEEQLAFVQDGIITGSVIVQEVILHSDSKEHDVADQNIPKTTQTINEKLLTIPASYYTLQLSGMSSKKSLQKFTVKHNLPQPQITVYQTIRKTKPWYVVIYGQYEKRQDALFASKNLPGTFANMSSWVKTYQTVHQDLELNNE